MATYLYYYGVAVYADGPYNVDTIATGLYVSSFVNVALDDSAAALYSYYSTVYLEYLGGVPESGSVSSSWAE